MKPEGYNFPEISRNVYDIDAFELLDKLRLLLSKHKDVLPSHLKDLKFIKESENDLIKYMRQKGINLKENQKYRNYILPSSEDQYPQYLGYKLLTIDPHHIETLLIYQSKNYLGNGYAKKDNFIGLVQFTVYNFVKSHGYLNLGIRQEKIMNWVTRNREISNKGSDKQENKPLPPAGSPRNVSIDTQFGNLLATNLTPYFEENQIKNLFALLSNNEQPTKLCFNGNINQLVELFKRLRYNSKLSVKTNEELAEWIQTNFAISSKDNKPIELKLATISQILRKSSTEPPKSRRILEDLAPFIIPSKRGKDQSPLK